MIKVRGGAHSPHPIDQSGMTQCTRLHLEYSGDAERTAMETAFQAAIHDGLLSDYTFSDQSPAVTITFTRGRHIPESPVLVMGHRLQYERLARYLYAAAPDIALDGRAFGEQVGETTRTMPTGLIDQFLAFAGLRHPVQTQDIGTPEGFAARLKASPASAARLPG